jgi:hypothetical protein
VYYLAVRNSLKAFTSPTAGAVRENIVLRESADFCGCRWRIVTY